MTLPAGANVILTADDFGMTEGVSRGIEELAIARRLSATGGMVTFAHWPEHGARLAALRPHLAIGLHFNLTLGRPCGLMPTLAPEGVLPPVGTLIKSAVLGRIPAGEIEAEFLRQVARFEEAVGNPPDFVDGHQHVHALPGIRGAVLSGLAQAFAGRAKPFVRDPFDHPVRILERKSGGRKHMALATLAIGFGLALKNAGLSCNDGFAGVSAFDRASDYRRELASFFMARGRCHLVMCHPGHPSPELAALDPVVDRREDEFQALMQEPSLTDAIWHPTRSAAGLDWPAQDAVTT